MTYAYAKHVLVRRIDGKDVSFPVGSVVDLTGDEFNDFLALKAIRGATDTEIAAEKDRLAVIDGKTPKIDVKAEAKAAAKAEDAASTTSSTTTANATPTVTTK